MDAILGIPKDGLLVVLAVPLGLALAVLILSILRKPTLARMGIRNAGRRKLQSLLMIVGLAVSSMLITGSLTLGDTLQQTLVDHAAGHLGSIELTLEKVVPGLQQAQLFDEQTANSLRVSLRERQPELHLSLALTGRSFLRKESDPVQTGVDVLGLEPGNAAGYGPITKPNGSHIAITELAANEILVSKDAADHLQVTSGDSVTLQLPDGEVSLLVRAVIAQHGIPVRGPAVVMNLAQAQHFWKTGEKVNLIVGALPNVAERERSQLAGTAVQTARAFLADPAQVEEAFNLLREDPLRPRLVELAQDLPTDSPLREPLHQLQIEADQDQATESFKDLISNPAVSALLQEALGSTDQAVSLREALRSLTDYRIEAVRNEALHQAELAAGTAGTIFLLFGLFSLMTSLTLLVLLFMLLGAERRKENGILRAVGMQRSHVAFVYLTEGLLYILPGALLGQVLGWWVGRSAVNLSATVFYSGPPLERSPAFVLDARSLAIGLCLTLVLCVGAVLISAARVARVQVVPAIRGLPDSVTSATRGIIRRVLTTAAPLWPLAAGGLLLWLGTQSQDATLFMAGASLALLGLSLILKAALSRISATRQHGSAVAMSLCGALVIGLWALPLHPADPLGLADYRVGTDLFFVAGAFAVPALLLLLVFNARWIVDRVTSVVARHGRTLAALRLAVSFPLRHRLRTGMAVAIVSLVMMSVIVISSLYQSSTHIYHDSRGVWGGFDIQVVGPVEDLSQMLDRAGLTQDVAQLAPMHFLPVQARQRAERERPWVTFPLQAGGATFVEVTHTHLPLKLRSPQYPDDASAWRALAEEEGTAILTYDVAELRRDFTLGRPATDLRLTGFFLEDDTLPPIHLELRLKGAQEVQTVRVIGIASPSTIVPAIYAGSATAEALIPYALPANGAYLQLGEGVSANGFVNQFNRVSGKPEMEVTALSAVLQSTQEGQDSFNVLLQSFIALGLVVGVVAMAVLQLHGVVERRQQIGLLRALGFSHRFVRTILLLESMTLTVVGLVAGAALGLYLSYQMVTAYQVAFPPMAFVIPWSTIGTVAAVASACSLLVCLSAANRAGAIKPAEALHYE